jgi:hypothetical protein
MSEKNLKCDFCNGRLTEGETIYTYVTPSTGTLEEAEAGKAFWCQDPEWAACNICHEVIQAQEADEMLMEQAVVTLVRRSLSNQQVVVIGGDDAMDLEQKMHEDQIDFIVGVVKAFFEHRSPGHTVGAA